MILLILLLMRLPQRWTLATPDKSCLINNHHTFSHPEATYCRSPGIILPCQLPVKGFFTCLTFDDLVIDSPQILTTYRGYSLVSETNQGIRMKGIDLANNSLTPQEDYASTWPNYLYQEVDFDLVIIHADSYEIPDQIDWADYRQSSFSLLSLTITSFFSRPPVIINIWGLDLGNYCRYNYTIYGLRKGPNFLVLNWVDIYVVKIFPGNLIIFDSLVVTRRD